MRLLKLGLVASLVLMAGACRLFADGGGESRPLPGPPWAGQGQEGISQAEAEAFREHGLYWWGPAFAGFNLQAILLTANQVTLIYGRCTIPAFRDGGCAAPLSIQVQPLCALTPQTARQAYPGPEEELRGGALLLQRNVPERGEATATFWTGDAVVRVHAGAVPQQLEESLQAILGLNVPVGPGEALAPPEFERCT